MNNKLQELTLEKKKFLSLLSKLDTKEETLYISQDEEKIVFNNATQCNLIEARLTFPNDFVMQKIKIPTKDIKLILQKLPENEIKINFSDRYIEINQKIKINIYYEECLKPFKLGECLQKISIPTIIFQEILTRLSRFFTKIRETTNDSIKIEILQKNISISINNNYFYIIAENEFFNQFSDSIVINLYSETALLLHEMIKDSKEGDFLEIQKLSNDIVIFLYDIYSLTSIQSKFKIPNRSIIEEKIGENFITLERKEFENLITQSTLISRYHDFKYYILIQLDDQELKIIAKNSSTEFNDKIKLEFPTKEITRFGINSQNIKDCLNCCEGEKIKLYFSTRGRPVKIIDQKFIIYLSTFSEVIF